MIDTDKITADRSSRTSSPSLPSLSTSSDISSIHARSTPKIAAGIIVGILAIGCVIGMAFYFVSSSSSSKSLVPRSDLIKKDRILSTQPQFISFDSQRRSDSINATDESELINESEDVKVPFFPTPILRNHLRTKYTDGQDPEGPLTEKHGVYYRSSELTTSTAAPKETITLFSTLRTTKTSTTTTQTPTTSTQGFKMMPRSPPPSPNLSKRSRYIVQRHHSRSNSNNDETNDFKPFIPYANLHRHNYSDFGARRRGFIRENINNPLVRRQNGLETISTHMDRRPGRLPFHPQGPKLESPQINATKEINGTENGDNLELRKGLISNIYQLVGNAKSEIDNSQPPQRPLKPPSEHPESIFARFISKFRDRLTSSGPWAPTELTHQEPFNGRGFQEHHSTASLLFISLGILLMNALSGTNDSEVPQERSLLNNADTSSSLELDSLLHSIMDEGGNSGFKKYMDLIRDLQGMQKDERPKGVDCIMQEYCIELNSLSLSEDSVTKLLARLNSVGVKLIMSKIQGYEPFLDQFSESFHNWQPIPCEDIFKLCASKKDS